MLYVKQEFVFTFRNEKGELLHIGDPVANHGNIKFMDTKNMIQERILDLWKAEGEVLKLKP